ncbi:hypothetical protein BGW38_009602, partial [Lunasporangiospora selenospora]
MLSTVGLRMTGTVARGAMKPVAIQQIRHFGLVSEKKEDEASISAQSRSMSTAITKKYPGPIHQPSNAVEYALSTVDKIINWGRE